MDWIKFCFLSLFLLCQKTVLAQEYAESYPEECHGTLAFWTSHKTEFEEAAARAGVSPRFMFAIVAPEISQFASLVDKAQTYALKVLYVQQGKAYANFSIGLFQMKPSFVEQLEAYVRADKELAGEYPDVLLPADSKEVRIKRVERLETQDWQMAYLMLFCRVISHRFGDVSFATEEEKLRFYANAYNRGFLLDEKQLRQAGGVYFPFFAIRKFRYADVALWFYRHAL